MTTSSLTTAEIETALATVTAADIAAVHGVLDAAGLITATTHFSYFGLLEPDKRELFPGVIGERRFRAMLVDMAAGSQHDVVVCPAENRVVSNHTLAPAVDGQLPVVLLEFSLVEEVIHKDERWLAAMQKRGLTDLSQLRVNPLSAGIARSDNETGRRLQRCFTFVQKTPDDLGWAHPVDGVTVIIDMVTREVLDVIDYVDFPIPVEDGNYHLAEWRSQPDRAGIKPLEITKPEGPSFTIDDNQVLGWAGWSLQLGFDQREGLILRNLAIEDAGVPRSVIYRASIAEMLAPYGEPSA